MKYLLKKICVNKKRLLHQKLINLGYAKKKDEQATEVTEEQCIAFLFHSLFKVDTQNMS